MNTVDDLMENIVKIKQAFRALDAVLIDDVILGDPRFEKMCSEVGAVYFCPRCKMDEAAMFFEETSVLFFICSCGYKGFFTSSKDNYRRTASVWDRYVQ